MSLFPSLFLNAVPPYVAQCDYTSPERSDWSCTSCISHKDAQDLKKGDQLEVLEYGDDDKWMPSEMPSIFYNEAALKESGWRRVIEYQRYFRARVTVRDRGLEALEVLAETISGVAREYVVLLIREKYHLMAEYGVPLQSFLCLLGAICGAWSDSDWWRFQHLYIPSLGIYHCSFHASTLDRRILFEYEPERPWKDLVQVMQMALPRFREMNIRRETLSNTLRVGFPSLTSSIAGEINMANIVTCLDIAESVSKLVPVVGAVLEGACGVIRKVVQAAESARATRDVCRAIAEHTACITLAIVNEIGQARTVDSTQVQRICELWTTINDVERKITALSGVGKMKYYISRGRINEEAMALRQKVDNARVAFQIRNDISISRLLADLQTMHTCLMSRVDDLLEGQKITHDILRMLLVEVHQQKALGAYVGESE